MSREADIIQGLVARGLPLHVAQGVTANMIAESGLDTGINELNPIVPGSRGGFGLNQWTGPRRRAIESAARERGVPVDDLDFQLDFTMEELRGPERRAFDRLMRAGNAEEAARSYSNDFLRPGIPHLDARLRHARRIAGGGAPAASSRGGQASAGSQATQGQQVPQQPMQDASQAFAAQYPGLVNPGQRQEPGQQQENALAQDEPQRRQRNALDPEAFMSRRRFGEQQMPPQQISEFRPRSMMRRST